MLSFLQNNLTFLSMFLHLNHGSPDMTETKCTVEYNHDKKKLVIIKNQNKTNLFILEELFVMNLYQLGSQ